MKIPSLKLLVNKAKITFFRFTIVILASIIGAVVMIYLVGKPFEVSLNNQPLYNIVMTCTIGISFILSLVFIGERLKSSRLVFWIIQFAGIVLLFVYYFTLSSDSNYVDIARFLSFMIASHLLVSFSPFANKRLSTEINGFWQFNQLLFIRILITAVYSGALYLGLTVAILSFDKLFNVHFDDKIYLKLFFVILGFFNTWFFLSGMPENHDELETQSFYPKGLKIFTQYVLLPLVIIYLLILYLYMGKIIIQWQLPVGWVSYLVLGFSATGILSLLLIHLLRNLEGNNWIKIFSKVFYLILFPLIVLLFVAILRRTDDYGITERRYYVFVLACWLTGIALYFTFSKIKNIKLIPISLCLIAFLTSIGPWGAFSISQNNQFNRLKEILVKNEILVNEKIQKTDKSLNDDERKNVSSIVGYLDERNALERIQPWFDVKLDTIKGDGRYTAYKTKTAKIVELMGIEYYAPWKTQNERYLNYNIKDLNLINLNGYDNLINYRYYSYDTSNSKKSYQIDSVKIEISYLKESSVINIQGKNRNIYSLNINEILEKLSRSSSVQPEMNDMSIEKENEFAKAKIIFMSISGEKSDAELKINNFNVYILLKIK